MPDSNYIKPRVREFRTFQDAEENFSKYGDLFPELKEGIDPIKNKDYFKRAFVVADPGYGKTRLLKEIISDVKNQGKIGIFVDLKKFADSKYPSLEEYLKNIFPELNDQQFHRLGSKDAIFCFDALDEIRDARFTSTVEELRRFFNKYQRISALVSSRIYFYKNHLFDVNNPSFNVWLIYAFNSEQIKKYLSSKAVSLNNIDFILSLLANNGRDLIISVPRYLELLPNYLENKGITDLKNLNRTDLFEYFIFNKLDLEEARSGTRGKEIIKRVLEMLALTMEIYQANVLSKEDLTTFLDDISSGLSQFWHTVPINVFYDNSLLKDGGDTIEFENTEFQEYLAAKHISRLNKPLQVAFDLAIDKDAEEVKPTWFSTLGFLSEIDQIFLKPLLDFGERNSQKIVMDERYFQLLTRFNVDQLNQEKKAEIFQFVFSYYQRVLHWIDWSIVKNLVFYYVDSLHSLLKYYADLPHATFQNEDQRTVQLANVSQVIGYLIRQGKLTHEQLTFWRNKLVIYANEIEGSGVLQRHALFALEAFKDPSLISQLPNPWKHNESLVRRRFIEFCIETDPNSIESIDLFITAITAEEYEAYEGIGKITKAGSLLYLLNSFLDNDDFLVSFIDRDKGLFNSKSTYLLKNIKAAWNDEIKKVAKKILIKSFENKDSWYKAADSTFILGLAELLQSNDVTYVYELIEEIKNGERTKHIHNLSNVIADLLTTDNIDTVYEKSSQDEDTKWQLFRALQKLKFSKKENSEAIYEAGRKYYSAEYADFESRIDAESQKEMRARSTYEEFKFKLEPEEGKYMPNVFSFFNDNHKAISGIITPEDKTRLSELIIGSILSKLDPGEHGVKDSNDHQTHTMSSALSLFGDSIKTAYILGLDVSDYKKRIINYVPFAFEEEELRAIFSLIGAVTADDLNPLIERYKDRSDDTWRYHPSAFLQTVQKYNFIDAVPILKEFVIDGELSIYDRKESMKVISNLTKDKEYLTTISRTYIGTEDKQLGEEANGLLISEYQDQLAIEWRIQELKTRSFTFVRQEGVHSMGQREMELDRKEFAGPLYSVSDEIYEGNFLSLLERSFELIDQDEKFLSYSSYLWELVYAYFENRKKEGNYRPLNALESFVAKFQGRKGANWFTGRLNELKKVYLEYVGKPPTYTECIQLYNKWKNANYIKINNHEDLLQEVTDVIENEIAKFLIGEGKTCLNQGETDVQKQLKTEIENAFLRRNFRPTDIREDFLVWREAQDLTDKRCDFVISYGFLGPILIELKLTSNSDLVVKVEALKTKKSFNSLQQYISSFRPKYTIFLVLDNKDRTKGTKWIKHLTNIKVAYETISSVKVIGLPVPS